MQIKPLQLNGLELTDPASENSGAQVIYLDIDDRQRVGCGNPEPGVMPDHIDVADAGGAPGRFAGLTGQSNAALAGLNVAFTAALPEAGQVYSTSDAGNRTGNDQAFVFAGNVSSASAGLAQVIAPAATHLLGVSYAGAAAPSAGLGSFAAVTPVSYLVTDAWGHDYATVYGKLTDSSDTNSYWYCDVEKDETDTEDDLLCWAAAASNILQWGGWTNHNNLTYSSEDGVLAYFADHWTDDGAWSSWALGWWLTGNDNYGHAIGEYMFGNFASRVDVPGGNFFAGVNLDEVVKQEESASSDTISFIMDYLNAGYGIALSIYTEGSGHAVTCWGYKIDSGGKVYLEISDSDSDMDVDNRADAENKCIQYEVRYDTGTPYISITYQYFSFVGTYDYYIVRATALRQYDSYLIGQGESFSTARNLELSGNAALRRGNIDGAKDTDYYVFTAGVTGKMVISVGEYDVACTQTYSVSIYDGEHNCLMSGLSGESIGVAVNVTAGKKYYVVVTDGGNYQSGQPVGDYTYLLTLLGSSGGAVAVSSVVLSNSSVKQRENLTMTATGVSGSNSLDRAVFLVDNKAVGVDTDGGDGWSIVYNTGGLTVGSHTVSVLAYDIYGNVSTSAAQNVTILAPDAPAADKSAVPDAFESDNVWTGAKTITLDGQAQVRSLGVSDVDWVTFAVRDGYNVAINLSGFYDADGAGLTSSLELYKASGDGSTISLAESKSGVDGAAVSLVKQLAAGVYYLKVSGTAGDVPKYELAVSGSLANHRPVVTNFVTDKVVGLGQNLSIKLPSDYFSDVDGDIFTVTATLQNGDALPSWLTFDAATMTLIGTPAQAGTYMIKTTAADGFGNTVSDTFKMEVKSLPDLVFDGALAVSASLVYPGSDITISGTVKNIGASTAAMSTLRIYVSTDSNITGDDLEISAVIIPTLTANGGKSFSVAVSTADWTVGTYYIGAIADAGGVLTEGTFGEADNTSNILTVTVASDTVSPTIVITPSTTAVTKNDVVLTALFDDNAGLASKMYRIGSGLWVDYTAAVTVSANATVSFKAVDTSGNETIEKYTVSNIDKTAPTIRVTPSSTFATKEAVTLTVSFSDGTGVAGKQYKIGTGGEWTDYVSPILISDNVTVYFKAVDTVGNESTLDYAVANIDRIAPTVTVTPSTALPTRNNVVLTAVFADNMALALKKYKIGDAEQWVNYSSAITVSANTVVYFKAVDGAGNETLLQYTVNNIDKVAPTITVSASDSGVTNQNVILTVNFSDDVTVVTRQYKIGLGAWTDYVSPISVSANTTVDFKAVDGVGNQTVAQYVVGNIDKTAPVLSAAPAAAVNRYSATVSWTAATDNVNVAGYILKINDTEYRTLLTSLALSNLAIGDYNYQLLCYDTAGNRSEWSGVQSFRIADVNNPELRGNPLAAVRGDTVTFRWTAATDNTAVAGYILKIGGNEYNVTGSTYQLQKAAVGTFDYQILAYDAAGNRSLWSKSQSFTVVDARANQYEDDDYRRLSSVPVLGLGKPVTDEWVGLSDAVDFRKLEVFSGMYSLTLSGLVSAAKATIYSIDVNGALKALKTFTITPKLDKQNVISGTSGTLSGLLLSGGSAYYVAVEAPGAAKGLSTSYNLTLDGVAFTRCNEEPDDDWTNLDAVATFQYGNSIDEWVGFGDKTDYRQLQISSSGSYDFTLSGVDNAVKLTVYTIDATGKWKALKTVAVTPKFDKAGNVIANSSGTLSGLLLAAGQRYYVAVDAPGAAKALNTDYHLAFGGTQFNNAYNGLANNTWDAAGVGELDLAAGVTNEWVGFGDATDYFKFELAANQAGNFGFSLDAAVGKSAAMTLFKVALDKKGNEILVKVKVGKSGLYELGAGEYSLMVASADGGKGGKNTSYDISVTLPVASVWQNQNVSGLIA